MKKFLYWLTFLMLLIFIPITVFAQTPPAMTYKIGGTVTIDDTVITQGTFTGFSIEVTKDGNVALVPLAETTSLLPSDAYIVDIPVYDQYHTGAATPGETLEIHVYEGSTELTVAWPYPAEITMGDGGTTNYTIDIDAYTSRTLIITNPDHGSITPSPMAAGNEYSWDTEVTLTATPDNGYVFSRWTGDVEDPTSSTTTIFMDDDQTVSASFVADASDNDDSDGGGDGGGGGGGGGIFGEISFRDLLGYHFDGKNSDGIRVYMPVTNAYKALKGAQTHVEGFAPNIASFVRSGFDMLEQRAERNKDGFLYRVGTYTFPVLGKIAEYYLDIVGAERLKADAYADTTISIEEFKTLEEQGKAVAPHRVTFEKETHEGTNPQ